MPSVRIGGQPKHLVATSPCQSRHISGVGHDLDDSLLCGRQGSSYLSVAYQIYKARCQANYKHLLSPASEMFPFPSCLGADVHTGSDYNNLEFGHLLGQHRSVCTNCLKSQHVFRYARILPGNSPMIFFGTLPNLTSNSSKSFFLWKKIF